MPRLTTEAFDMDTSLLPPRDPIILKKEIDKIKKQIKSLKNQLTNISDDISTNALSRDLARAESMLKKLELIETNQLRIGGLIFAIIGFVIIYYTKN